MQNDIAVIGMLCNVPGADSLDKYWELIITGKESIRNLTDEEIAKQDNRESKNFVAAGGFIDGIDLFDAEYFGFSPREAELMDPQHRLWLQACQHLLEIAGYTEYSDKNIGIFASTGPNAYLKQILEHIDSDQYQTAVLGNVSDCFATRVSYLLNLTGPSMSIQCGCSSSLVAIHQARMSLLTKQCNAALAGGICLAIPQYQGYLYIDGGFASPDGHCRPFSSDAAGTVFSSGYGVVLLKRLTDALKDGDHIYAVIRGSAINNDGANKASFTAPSVEGQAEVIAKAIRVSNLTAEDIDYIETHGTATPIGDPIELAAIEMAFKQSVVTSPSLYIGSIKANIGHLDTAAGVIGFIKTCLMLYNKKIPPQINFKDWNEKCFNPKELFKINSQLKDWITKDKRRAGVSAFGFGGTNAHVILEEMTGQAINHEYINKPIAKLVVLSGRSKPRLMSWIKELSQYLISHSEVSLEALTYTLQTARNHLSTRFLISVNSIPELISTLQKVTEEDFISCKLSSELIDIHDKDLHNIMQMWLSGCQLNWQSIYDKKNYKKIFLPAASLQKQSYWLVKEEKKQNRTNQYNIESDVKNALYQMTWKQVLPLKKTDWLSLSPVLLVGNDQSNLVKELKNYFIENNIPYYWITEKFTTELMEYEEQWLINKKWPVSCILNLSIDALNEIESLASKTLFQLIKHNQLMNNIKQISILTMGTIQRNHVQSLPLSAILIGFCRAIGQEFPHINHQLIDLEENNVKQTEITILSSEMNDVIVWRDNLCWQQDYQLHPESKSTENYFVQKGTYILMGGLGDVASVYVDFLAKDYQANLILIGKSKLPDLQNPATLLVDDYTNQKIQQKVEKLKQWQKQNFLVKYYACDITNYDEISKLFNSLISDYGHINGIIHCAGAGSDMHYKVLVESDWDHCWKLFAPKLMGVSAIANLAKQYDIQTVLITSSISSILTGIGLGPYGASHNLLDMVVSSQFPHWRIINWDAWNFYQKTDKGSMSSSELDKIAISHDQGIEILRYAFKTENWQQLFVSFANLQQRNQYWAHHGYSANNISSIQYPRPNLHTEYIAPTTILQKQLTYTWQNLLGLEKVGINDNFFELGGHSLLALEFMKKLQTEYNYACSVVEIFEAPTILQLANKMEDSNNHIDIFSKANLKALKQLTARQSLLVRKN